MNPEAAPDFGMLIRSTRKNAGFTQEGLAERAGVSSRTISDLERGVVRAPRRDTMELLADALDLSAKERGHWKHERNRLAKRADRSVSRPGTCVSEAIGLSPLTASLTSFIGREQEIRDILTTLDRAETRLLTLTGTGGVGKTRLALVASATAGEKYGLETSFVSLALINDPALLLPTIASTLGLRETAGESLFAVLTAHLRAQRLLLVLDNFEHVIEAAPHVSNLLIACPELTVLTTSRAPLRIQGEREYPVAPLDVPDLDAPRSLDELTQVEAIELFIERAGSVQPTFLLTVDNATDVATICRKLEGLPLAIELAAARTRMFSPNELLTRLDSPLAMLTSGPRNVPARQQTLRNTIAWSYDLLDEEEQRLLRQFAIFRGGWTLEAAEAVADEGGEVLAGLEVLIEDSLAQVRAMEDGGYRYGMLETIREFGLERLASHSEAQDAHERHAAYFTQLAEQAQDAVLNGPDQKHWLTRLESDHANLQAAFDWVVSSGDALRAHQLALSLYVYWYASGRGDEGRRWSKTVLDLPGDVSVDMRAAAAMSYGMLVRSYGQYDDAEALLKQAISLYRESEDLTGLVDAYICAAGVAWYRGEYDRASDLYEQGFAFARRAGNPRQIADALGGLSIMAVVDGDFEQSEAFATQCLQISREGGDLRNGAMALGYLGHIALLRGDFDAADDWARQCVACAMEVGDFSWLAFGIQLTGYIELERKAYGQAQEHLSESLRAFWKAGELGSCAVCFEGLAGAAAGAGQHARAARLLGVAAALRERVGAPLPPPWRELYDRTVAAVCHGLSANAFEAAKTTGGSWPLKQAVEYALQPLDGSEPEADPEGSAVLTAVNSKHCDH